MTLTGTAGAEATIVDASGLDSSVVVITGGSPHIEGLTITGGNAVSGGSPPGNGGGVRADGMSEPTLKACIIRNNASIDSGGGAYRDYPGVMRLESCKLSNNVALNGGGGATGSLQLTDCLVEGNQSSYGGGLHLLGGSTATGCVIRSNHSLGNGGGVATVLSGVSRCVIQGNVAEHRGGGMYGAYFMGGNAMPPITDVQLLGNTAVSGDGGGLYYEALQWMGQSAAFNASLTRVICAGNTSGGPSGAAGDGVVVKPIIFFPFAISSVTLDHCTFNGDAIYVGSASIEVMNSILVPVIYGGNCGNCVTSADYTDQVGGKILNGTGNLFADPLWVDPANYNFELQPGSPCIDSGDPAAPPDPDGSPSDMGAVAFVHGWKDLGGGIAGSAGQALLVGTGPLEAGSGVTLELTGAPPLQSTTLLLSHPLLGVPFKGGTLWPVPNLILGGLPADVAGSWLLTGTWPVGIPGDYAFYLQVWFPDGGAPQGFAASNGLRAVTP